MKNRNKSWIVVLCIIFLGMAAFSLWYVNDYYHAGEEAQEALTSGEEVTIEKCGYGYLFDGSGEDTAFIFYPGAKVEDTAYAPLMFRLAEEGIDCFLVKMPCNLAVFGKNKAADIINEYRYDNWYIGGHSLGGAMAAAFVSANGEKIDGLVLLAAYPTENLSSENLCVLSVYGSRDGVLNPEKFEEGRAYMPESYTELCIDGGNHAGFGYYGEQKGDKEAGIDRRKQQEQTIEAILGMIKKAGSAQ